MLDKEDIILKMAVPPQKLRGAITQTIETTTETLKGGTTGFLVGNAIVNFVLQGSLAQVWGMINNL